MPRVCLRGAQEIGATWCRHSGVICAGLGGRVRSMQGLQGIRGADNWALCSGGGCRSATTDGLVHVSQLADDFVKDIESVVKVGDEVQVRITEINADTNKVSLSMRSENAPQQQRQQRGGGGKKEIPQEFKDMDDKTFIKGTVSSVTDYGAFVTISEGVDGLVHISQLAEERVESTAKYVKVGQEVDVRIIDVDSKKGKLSLSMKAWSEPPPRDETEDIKSFVDESPTGKTAFEIAWEKAQSKVAA